MLSKVDPRIRRTRAALRDALARLLRDRSFEDITLLEIAEAADLNRATIYKHHADKVALLDAWIADELSERLCAATSKDASSGAAVLAAFVAATCECMRWIGTLGRPDDRLLRPIADARVRALLLHAIEFALAQKLARAVIKPELAAAMASSAICGAAAVWAAGSGRALDAHVAKVIDAISALVVGEPAAPRLSRSLSFDASGSVSGHDAGSARA